MGVRICDLNLALGQTMILRAVDLEVQEGEFFTLLGPSGCGKTTLLRTLAGLERPMTGKIWIGERLVNDAERGLLVPPEARDVGFVFQSYALWPHMTVAENVAFPFKVRRRPATEIRSHVEWALQMVGMSAYLERPVTALSGGQQQRVAIARAIVAQPKLLLMDEPLSNLDADLRREVRDEIRKLQRTLGITTVYVTHDQEEAFAISDRIAVMYAGQVQQVGTPEEIYLTPATEFVSRFLGQVVLTGELRQVDGRCWLEVGGERLPWPGSSPTPDGPVQLALDASKLRVAENPEGTTSASLLWGRVERATFAGRWGWRARVRLWETVTLELYTGSALREGETVRLLAEPGFLRPIGSAPSTPSPVAPV